MPVMMLKNVQLTVEESKVEEFLKLGYSQVDEDGKITKTGEATDLKAIKAENETLKAAQITLSAENEKLKADNDKLKKENTKLKKDQVTE